MHLRRIIRRRYARSRTPVTSKPKAKSSASLFMLSLSIFLLFLAAAAIFLKDLSTQIAVSDASDIVTVRINNAIAEIMKNGDYGGDYFVTFEKDSAGEVTAISSNHP